MVVHVGVQDVMSQLRHTRPTCCVRFPLTRDVMTVGSPGADSSNLVTRLIDGKPMVDVAAELFGRMPVLWGRYFTSVATSGLVEYRARRENQALRDRAGTVITVPNVADGRPDGQVFRIEVDKPAKAVRAFGRNNEVVAFYPASVGSREKPAPSGTYHVGRVVKDPTYHYDPKFQFKGVRTDRELTIAPGPNNPVGLVWFDLNKPTY